jgi:hypothetical protein
MVLLLERATGLPSYARPLDPDNRHPVILVDFDAFALGLVTLASTRHQGLRRFPTVIPLTPPRR